MKAVVKEEHNAPKVADDGREDGGHGNRRGNRRGARRFNNATGGTSSGNTPNAKYPTRNKDLPDNLVFDNTGHNDAANFQRTLKGLANFLHTTYSAEVATAILKMQTVNIALEDEPTPRKDATGNDIALTAWDIHKWKEEYNAQHKTLKVYNDSMPKAYIHIYNQCSTNLKNDLEAAPAFAQVESNKDPIGLLKLIQGLCCSYDSKTQSVMATVASHKKLFTFFQRDGIDNSSYHREFIALVETIETYGGHGAIGITPTFVAQKLREMHSAGTCVDPASPTSAELAAANSSVREEFLAALMLSGANRDRYGALRNELANQFTFGSDLYPKSTDQCLTMLNRRVDNLPRTPRGPPRPPPGGGTPSPQVDEALVFAQDTTTPPPAPGKPKNDAPSKTSSSSGSVSRGSKVRMIICKTCGQQGHISTHCPQRNPPAQVHAMAAAPDDASVPSDDDSVLIMTQTHEAIEPPRRASYADIVRSSGSPTDAIVLAQPASKSRRPISSDLLLLDSQSTVHLFSQPEHVANIRPAATPIRVHCNKGTLDTTQEADFGDTPVYFDARGIANVLSLYQLGQKFQVTYDSKDRGGVFKVFTPAGVVEFAPTKNGLHVLNLKNTPEAAFILVNDASLAFGQSPVSTVRKNYEGFTKRQVQQATRARRIMGMIGAPTQREYQSLVRNNLLNDCPVTNSDIVNAHTIFGPDLANLRGKMVRRKPVHVNTELVDIPQSLVDRQKNVTLVADVMFVNGVAFLVSSSRNIMLTTIEHAPDRKAPKLGYLLHRIMKTYARAGFNVHTILMDNEFNKIRDYVDATLNTPAASEHIGEIERRIRVIKERCRGIISTLPYAKIPRIMLIYLLHHVVMWLNNFPIANGISTRFSPREIMQHNKLSIKHHCKAPFGSYCEVHEDNDPTNGMQSRGLPTICLGPTGNIQGTYSFLNLSTGLVIKRRRFVELPAPDSVIQRVNDLAETSGVPTTLVFADRTKTPFDWPDNEPLPNSLDTTPMAKYPNIPAEMPGVLLERHIPAHDDQSPFDEPYQPDWFDLADEAAQNADLATTELLPPPPDVIEIDDVDDEFVYTPPHTTTSPFVKQEPTSPPTPPTPADSVLPSATPPRPGARARRLPRRFDDFHMFTTVADAHRQPPEYPYHTAGGTDVDLAIQDEERMAHICHFAMVHTATSINLAQLGQPTKKQYGLKAGLRHFGSRGDTAVTKELSQLHTMNCFRPRDPTTLTRDDRRNALTSLMFLTEKRTGEVKARACANGSVQRAHIAKEEAAAPTVTSEAIFIQSTIYANERRDVATCDIPGAFLQADNPDFVLMRLDGILAELMVKIAPTLYRKYVTTNAKGKPILYVQLEKAVYGMMKSALLFYRKLVADLLSLGFTINPYDPCVANKIIDGKQLTICWHVDDLFIGHVDPKVVTSFLDWLARRYDTTDKKLNIVRGHKHDYLGMNLDFSSTGAVQIDMINYIEKVNDAFPETITGVQSTPAGDRLFQVRPHDEAKFLPEAQARAFHHTTAQLLFLSRVRRDIQTTVAFLTTRVKKPDEDDWGKLKRVLRYLRCTRFLKLTLFAESLTNIVWYVDASHQLHDDCKGHTGSLLTFGRGATTSSSTKHKIPSKSSCESEIIGLYDKIGDVLWTRQFLEAQGYQIKTNIVYQDNMSTLSLAKNGYVSSSKRTKHIKAKYFFVRHFHNTGELDLQYCPTEHMWADVLTKPLQGAKFRLMRAFLMNCPVDYHEDPIPSPLPTLTPTLSTHKFVPLDNPSDIPMKQRSLRPTPSSRGCVETKSLGTSVETKSRGTKVPSPTSANEFAPKSVTWKTTSSPDFDRFRPLS